MKRIIAIICLALILVACGKKTEPDFVDTTVVCTDETGTAVSLPVKPQNVAVLFSSFADIWVTAGGEVTITVGETVERGFADENAILVDGGAGKNIDNETLIAASPDIVICSADIEAQLDTVEICRDAGIPAVALRVEGFEDYLEVLKLFTTLTGCDENYETYGADIKEEIDGLTSYKSDAEILFIRAGSSARATKAKVADDHFAAAMLKELGTYNIAEKAPVLLDGLSFEEIIVSDPEHIFVTTMGDEDAAKEYMNSLLETAEWSSLSAVKNGNVHFLPKELFQYKPNARWAEAYRYLIDILEGEAK